MLEKNDSPSPNICLIHDSNGLSEEEGFLKVTPRITIERLKESREQSSYIVLGTMKGLLDIHGWWYTACECNKKVILDEGMYYSSKCNKHVAHVSEM
ncbi:replication protein A 70 kDa DNA-binding subunit E [Trifolium repens]|nr:replication protein A 70 kDa DNA-binding subunit E [Trifolium repens]